MECRSVSGTKIDVEHVTITITTTVRVLVVLGKSAGNPRGNKCLSKDRLKITIIQPDDHYKMLLWLLRVRV